MSVRRAAVNWFRISPVRNRRPDCRGKRNASPSTPDPESVQAEGNVCCVPVRGGRCGGNTQQRDSRSYRCAVWNVCRPDCRLAFAVIEAEEKSQIRHYSLGNLGFRGKALRGCLLTRILPDLAMTFQPSVFGHCVLEVRRSHEQYRGCCG